MNGRETSSIIGTNGSNELIFELVKYGFCQFKQKLKYVIFTYL